MALGVLVHSTLAHGAQPALALVDCPSMSLTVTTELLAIELRTLGIEVTPLMHWTVRCHGRSARVHFEVTPDSPWATGEAGSKPLDAPYGTASATVDLSSTDEAAWPRLIAISASELSEQRNRDATKQAVAGSSGTPQLAGRVQLVARSVKTKRSAQYLAMLGPSFGREGEPGTSLWGVSLGVERRLGPVGLLGVDLRSQWGRLNLRDLEVKWHEMSAALRVGATLNLRVVDVDATAGFRLGRLALTGQTTALDMAGRSLVGPSGGPFAAARLRRQVGESLFFALELEEGYCLTKVRGNDDGVSPILSVDGLWTNGTLSVGWKF